MCTFRVFKVISILNIVCIVAGQDNEYETSQNSGLILNTTGCKIRDFDVKFTKLPPKWGYICDERLVKIFKSNDDAIRFKMLQPFDSCCYRMITYSGMENADAVPCITFTNGMEANLTSDFVAIACKSKGKPHYTDRFAFVKKQQIRSVVNKRAYSVLMIGIDSVSRFRAHRHLRKTVQYLTKNNWLDFKGYHKIGSNTYPNLFAVATGNTSLPEYCETQLQCQHLPIWAKYKDAGYVTALGEDNAAHAIFYYDNASLTHHYLTPFLINAETKKLQHSLCSGRIQSGTQVLSYALEFAKKYHNRRSFGFFWICSFAHDSDYNLKSADNLLKLFFEELQYSGILDKTIVFLFADHGANFGMIPQEVFPEPRLPMLFMWVPPQFIRRHPKLYNNLVTNQERLTTPYNLHMTLYHILKLTNKTIEPHKPSGCPNCTSLFRIIPETQSCYTAGIKEEFCSCNANAIPNTSEDAQSSLMEALIYVERFAVETETMPCTTCARYTFDTLYRVRSFQYGNDTALRNFVLTVKMQPGDTVFELMVRKKLGKSGDGDIKPGENWNESVLKKSVARHEYKTTSMMTISEAPKDIDWCSLHRRNQYFCICMWDRPNCNKDAFAEFEKQIYSWVVHNQQARH